MSAFIYGETEPIASLVGTGVIAPKPTRLYSGSVRPANTITIQDRVIKSPIIPADGAVVTLLNCDVQLGSSGWNKDTRALSNNKDSGKIVARFCDIHATGPSIWVNGVGTKNFTVDRSRVFHVVDGFDSLGGMVVKGSLIEKLFRLKDPADAWGVTHNDGFQLVGGYAHRIFGCAIHAYNSSWSNVNSRNNVATTAIMLTPNAGPITGIDITHNWIYGGDYPINGLNLKRAKGNQGRISFNRFGGLVGQEGHSIDFSRTGSELITTDGNVWMSNGKPVNVRRV